MKEATLRGQMHQNGAQLTAGTARCRRILHRHARKSLILRENPPHAERCKIYRILQPNEINRLAAAVSDYLTLSALRSAYLGRTHEKPQDRRSAMP